MDTAAPPLQINNNLTSDGGVDRSSSPTAPDVPVQHGPQTGGERVCWASQSSSGLVVVTNEKQLAASETGTTLEALPPSLPLSNEGLKAALRSEGDTPERRIPPLDATQLASAAQPANDDTDFNPLSAHSEDINQNAEDVLKDGAETNMVNSADTVERVEALVETRLEEILDAQKVKGCLSGLEQTASSLQVAPASPNPPATPPLFDAGLVVSLQGGEVVAAETSDASEQVLAELVHAAAAAQEIVVVREEAHISGEWADVHLNRGYLLQRQDGSVCQAAIQLTAGDAKLYHDGVETEMELDEQPMEVYEFCELVEEVAEETVCASSSGGGVSVVQLPQSPGYEVNLFNALLENADEFTVKEDMEGDAIIISQQPLGSACGADLPSSGDLSNQNSNVAVGRRLLLDANQTVTVAHTSEVCLVQVAAITSESFTDGHTDSDDQTGIGGSQEPVAAGNSESLLDSSECQDGATEPGSTFGVISAVEDTAVSATINSSATQTPPPINQTPGVTVLGGESEVRLSLPEEKEEGVGPGATLPVLNQTLLLKPSEAPNLNPSPLPLAAVTNKTSAEPEECLTRPVPPPSASVSSSSSSSEPLSCPPDMTLTSVTPSTRSPLQLTSAALTQTSETPRSAKPEDRGPSAAAAGPVDDLEEEEEGEEEEEEEEEEDEEDEEAEASSPEEEEGSDEEVENKKSEMRSQRSSLQVQKWMADRAGVNSSPVSPSSSSSSYPGPSAACDWSTPRREKSSPLRGANGKFVSPSSICGFSPAASSPNEPASTPRPRGERHTDMAELAKHEADIELRTQALKREGFWALKRLGRLTEPPRPKVHWDYLCEEMQWLSADFAQERRWKRGVARKVVRMVMRHHEELRQKEEKAKRDEHAKIRRVASSIAKEVRAFWSSVEKVVQYKQQSRLEEKRKKALDLQLDFIVGQTEKYSHLLTKSLNTSRPPDATTPSEKPPQDEDDGDFAPPVEEEEDDEETIEVEEQQEGNDAESRRREIQLLKEEGLLPLDQLLSTLKLPPQKECEEEEEDSSDGTASTVPDEEEDGEFTANDEDAEDEEDTIAAQEKVEGDVNHREELDDLAREGDLSLEELLEKYRGAFTSSDPEAPSGCASRSSSDQEDSGEETEEDEREEDESDVETNSSSSDSAGDSADEEESEKDEGASEEEGEEEEECDEGMEVLLKEGDNSPPSSGSRPKKEISHIAATAESLQPKGYTLATTKVKTPIPFLLHGTLREYQHIGLEWLVTMYEKKLNGILADEMGLGKTIQTIALLAHLACEKGNWGPHLIIVPTSVMLNWEMELKRWCPGFKILTYFGSQKERKLKRQGWTKPNAFHVCITSYKLVLQDHQAFRRKSWRYLILDEAQNIKNFKSQRWQSLLNFNSHRRLLLTGTPLQNSLMELWSLMHFLMPHVFQSHREFKEWFSNPLTGMIEGSQEYNEGLVKRLHKVLRPFLLRRIKVDVEKQMPKKYEHVVRCRLSKRQRFLYDDFMAQASTRETLASGHFMSVINILMQLRKVCNHPNLFDPRPIQSPFITKPIVFLTASLVQDALDVEPLKRCDLSIFDLVGLERRVSRYQADVFLPRHAVTRQLIQDISDSPEPPPRPRPVRMKVNRMFQPPPKGEPRPVLLMNKPSASSPSVPTQTLKPSPPPPPPPPTTTTTTTPSPSEVASPQPQPAPVVQQVVCTVAASPCPRPPLSATQTAVRSSAPKPLLATCTPGIPAHPGPNPTAVMPQRVLLSPDMQARLPSGEVVSIAQLASLAGRPVSSCQGSKPVTFQLQGNKLTLSGAHIHQVPAAPPRTLPGNVMHLVSSGVQHHLITQPAQVSVQTAAAVRPAVATPACSTAPPTNRLPLNASSPAPASMVSNPGVVKIVVRQSSGKEGRPLPTLAMTPPPRVAPPPHPAPLPARPLQTAQRSTATAHYTLAPPRTPAQPPQPRPLLKVVQPPPTPHPPLPLPSGAEQPASSQVTSSSSTSSSSSVSKSSVPLQNATPTPSAPKPRPNMAAKTCPPPRKMPRPLPRSPFHMPWLSSTLQQQRRSRLDFLFSVNQRRCGRTPVYGLEVLDFLTFLPSSLPSPAATWGDQEEEKEEGEERKRQGEGWWRRSGHSSCLLARQQDEHQNYWRRSHAVADAILTAQQRLDQLTELVDRFTFVIPPVEAPPLSMHCCHPPPSLSHHQAVFSSMLASQAAPLLTRSLHRIQCYMRTQFPDLRLIQYDCGKLQVLHTLLRKLKTGGHRVLIFTQMTRMLDVLEQFLNYHGHIYLRLDGSTRVEQRQALMERFNADRRIFCFILSTRSGGVGVNLTGADTVVFYDSDWNPTMDAQAQDRCHRIGQTRDVHIYRLISERTVEENILKKANQKRMLGDMAIEGGNFTTAFFKQQTIRELFDMSDGEKREAAVELSLPPLEEDGGNKQSTTILEQALCRAEDEEDIVAASQAKAEQVAELAEFNENIPLDDGGEPEEAEELSKAEQEIAALVEQLTPIERYAMNFLEASLEDVCKEELKQAEEQVEAARKGLDQAKEEGLKLHASSDDEDFLSTPSSAEPGQSAPARRGRKPKDKTAPSTRTSGRLRGASPETEPEPTPTREPERLRSGLRGRAAAKTPAAAANPQKPSSARQQETNKSSKATSPPREQHAIKTRTNRTQPSQVTTASAATDSRRGVKEEEKERKSQESSLESATPSDLQPKDEDGHDAPAMSPPSTRSPRKRQSADVEVLRGLVEDSPSAKVLRKLPGRLVTVVEEKEPRRRRRRASGTGGGGSSEETAMEDNVEELNKDSTSSDPKPTATKPTEDQDSVPSVAPPPPPVRSYPPYSPPHLSPDMPVLRNLPVRRRLETESRMAAQLGEQLRGRAGNQSKKADAAPGRDATLTSTESNLNSLVTPLKRKRGRPPKTTLRSPESDQVVTPSPTSPSEEGTPTLSPKRRRGRPRKDSFTMSDAGDGLESEAQPELAAATADTSGTPLPAAASRHRDAEGTTEDSPRGPAVAHQEKADEALEPAPLATPAASVLTTPVINTPAVPAPTTPPLPSAPPPSQTVATSSPPDASSTSSVMPSPGGALMVTATTSTVPTPLVSAVDPTDSTVKSSELNSTPVNTSVATAATPSVVVRDSSSETPEATTASTSASIMLASSTTVDSAQLTTIKAASNSTPAPLASTAANQTLSSTQASSDSPKQAAASPAPVKTAQANPTISSTPVRTVLASSPNSTNTREAHQGSVAMAISEPSSTLSSAPIVNVLDQTPAAKAVKAPPQPDLTPPPTTEAPIGAPAEPLESLATSVAPPTSTRSVAPPAPMNTLSITKTEDTKTVLKEVEITETRQLSTSTPPTSKENSEQTPPTVTSPDIVSPTVSTASSPQVESTTSATTSSSSADMVHSNRALPPASITPVTSCVSSTSMPATVASEKESSESDSQRELAMEAKSEEATNRKKKRSSEDEADELQPKRRKTASSSRTKSDGEETRTDATAIKQTKDETKQPEASVEGQKSSGQKQPISRQSSRESTRSSSPSSGCSSTLTRHAHHKRTYENRHPTKRRPADASDAGKEEEDGRTEEGGNQETDAARRRHRSSSCCSSDSDSNGSGGEELRVTRSAKRRLQDQEKESIKEKMPQPPLSLERNVTSNTIESPDGAEPGIETVRVTRKSATSQPPLDTKPQTNSVPPPPPEPEVLGKRCSALNAAAKLLAMKGRVDTPGHTPRKDSGSKTAADKTQNTKSKSAPATPQSNSLSLTNSKPSAAKPSSSNQTSRPASRSTRQCPGSLVPPLDLEYRRSKPEDRSATKSVEGDAVSSSRGHSASSSDGEGGGGRSSRSRSSSNSSQRTLSSQNTERRSSRAASSGSERDRERSLERARREGRSYRESRRSQRLVPEAAAVGGAGSGGGSGAEGTPDRVLRSVAALAAVQARSPAASTRSSASQQRHNKT